MTAFIGASLTSPMSNDQRLASGKGFGLNDRYTDHQGNEFVFVQANGAITGAGYTCILDEAGQAAMVSTSNDIPGARLGVPLEAFADNDFGFVQIYGNCGAIRGAATAATDVLLVLTATAGVLDDAATGVRAEGIVLSATVGAGEANVAGFLQYPKVGETIA